MSAENVIINFVGDTDELKPVENVLDGIINKGGEVEKAWGKASAAMNDQTKATIDGNTKLTKSIEGIAIAAKSMDKAVIGGAYKNYLKEIQTQLGLTNKELVNYIQTARSAAQEAIFQATDEEAKQLTLTIEVMNDELKQLGVSEDGAGEKTKSLRSRIKEAKEELVAMAEAGLQGTPAFEELQQKAGNLDDQMRDLNASVKGLGSDTRNIDGLISLAGGLAGGFAIAQGAAALFGDEDEEVQKALLKVNAAMSILQGLQQIQILLQKESAAMLALERVQIYAKAVATEIQAAATGEATIAQKAYNIAQAASPIGAAILAITLLIGLYKSLNTETSEAEKSQERLNSVHEQAVENYAVEATKMDLLTDRVKKAGLSFQEKQSILKDYNKEFGETIGKAKDFEDAEKKIIDLGPSYIKMITLQAEAQAAFQLAVEESKKALIAQQTNGVETLGTWDALVAGAKNAFGGMAGAATDLVTLAETNSKKIITDATTAKDAFLKINEERLKEAEELQKKYNFKTPGSNNDKSGPTQNDLLKAAMEERKALYEKELIDLEINGQKETQIFVDKQKQILDVQKDIDLLGVKGINERALIKAEAEIKASDLQKDLDLKNAKDRNDLALANLQNELSQVQATGDDQTKIKKQILDEQASQEEKAIQDSELSAELKAAKILEIENKLNADKKAIDDAATKARIDQEFDTTELQKAGEILLLQRKLIGEKDKEVIAGILKQISDLKLQAITDEIAHNENLYSTGLISKEDYEKEKLVLSNKYIDAENGVIAGAFADRDKMYTDDLQKRMASIQAVFAIFQKGLSATGDTSAISVAISQIQNYSASLNDIFEKIKAGTKLTGDDLAKLAVATISTTQAIVNQIFADGVAARQQALSDDLSILEEQKQNELNVKGLTEQQKADIDAKYRQLERQEKIKAFIADKEAKKQQAIINGALAFTAALPNYFLAALVAISTLIQVSKIANTPVPRFRHGKVDIQGPGTTTSDSIPAMISRRESVINARSTVKWKDALLAINNDKFEHYLSHKFKDFTFPTIPEGIEKMTTHQQIDYDKLATAVADKLAEIIPSPTQIHNNFDGEEVKKFILNGSNKTEIKNKYFSMT